MGYLRNAAVLGKTWEGYAGEVVCRPAQIHHELWSSPYRISVHIAKTEGAVLYHGDLPPRITMTFWCGQESYLHDVPVADTDQRPLCKRCVAKYRD